MMVLATEAAPPALRGRLSLWLVEVRAGLYVGNYGARVRETIWQTVLAGIGEGNAVLSWASTRECGYELLMCGLNRREIVDADGLLVVANASDEAKVEVILSLAHETKASESDESPQ